MKLKVGTGKARIDVPFEPHAFQSVISVRELTTDVCNPQRCRPKTKPHLPTIDRNNCNTH